MQPSSVLAGPFNVNDAFVANELSGTPTDPNGVYTYGYTFTPANVAALDTTGLVHTTAFFGSTGLQGYYIPNNAIVPAVLGNVTNAPITTGFGVTVQPGELLLHPGGTSGDAFAPPVADADLRYTAPVASLATISGVFSTLSSGSTDVHVFINGISAFDANIAQGQSAAFNFTTALAANDKVDFLVGPSTDGIGSDSTGLFANISIANISIATPEPSVVIPALIGIGGALGYGLRRRKTMTV